VAEVLTRVLASPACVGKVLNVGDDHPLSIANLAALVVRTLGSPSRTRYIPYASAYSENFEDLRQRRPDLTRLRAAVGFDPKFSLERTMEDVAEWFRASGPWLPPARWLC
jgi:UDP-glucose 4-epimerase